MGSMDNKVEKFERSVMLETDKFAKKLENDIEAYKVRAAEQTMNDELERSYSMIQARIHQIKKQFRDTVAQQRVDAKRGILHRRAEIEEKVFAAVCEKILKYAGTKEYGAALESSIINAKKQYVGEKIAVYVSERDMEIVRRIDGVLPKCDIMLGGFEVDVLSKKMIDDRTFDTKIKEQREYFRENSGLGIGREGAV